MISTVIKRVLCREVFSDRGFPAVEARVWTENGAVGVAVCTAGVSVGNHEVVFTYDGGTRFEGRGVQKTVSAANEILAPELKGMDANNQTEIDAMMLCKQKKHHDCSLGGNTLAAISAAVLKAAAAAKGIPLYYHIGGEKAVQLPLASYGGYFGSTRYGNVLKAGVKPTCAFIAYDFDTFHEAAGALMDLAYAWRDVLDEKYGLRPCSGKGDVICAGFVLVPPGYVKDDRELWELQTKTIEKCGYSGRIGLQIDTAADSFYDRTTQMYRGIYSREPKTRDQMIRMASEMSRDYPFIVIEDPLHEEDYDGFAEITQLTGIQIVGDDLFTTDSKRVRQGAVVGAGNTVLMKVNQIGTITQALDMVKTAYEFGYGVMPCNSRGEGVDIVDYCVGIRAATIRECSLGNFGNRFLEIESELGKKARYAGKGGLKGMRFQKEETPL